MAKQSKADSKCSKLSDFLIENHVDVAQLFALFKDFAKSMDFADTDPDMFSKFLLQNAIEFVCMEIDPKQ